MPARISTRKSIRWLPEPPSEPTDTLVLGVNTYYVDLRVSLSDGGIDWAMAGERLILSENPLRVGFSHIIDSNGITGIDQGEFSKLPDGDDLEVGTMACPHLGGKLTPYEEVWHALPAPETGTISWILQSVDDGGKTFLAKVGGHYLALQEKTGEAFTAIRQEWVANKNAWIGKYEIGIVGSLPSIDKQAMLEGGKHWQEGENVVMNKVSFMVRAFSVAA